MTVSFSLLFSVDSGILHTEIQARVLIHEVFFQDEKDVFEFPDIFKDRAPPEEEQLQTHKEMVKENRKLQKKTWYQADIPMWFR